ncbi:hypothetical protein ACH5RR_037839 [Cinchona calisaya]|uniref:Uncharacterized protein n=1 Tax=Cinchona calisaya TaxID=153742 RepID=A0ABD2Y8K3_9GENT
MSSSSSSDDDDHDVAIQESASIDPLTNRPEIKSRKITGPPPVRDHQGNQENDDDQESVGENDIVEFHSKACTKLDMTKIKILKCVLDLEQKMNDEVLPDDFATSDDLLKMVQLETRLILAPQTMELIIDKLESEYWENVGEYIPIPLHQEIFDLSKKIWGSAD